MSSDDTSALVGGPIKRNGAKGKVAPYIVPHFAPAKVYAEAFFGAGSVFYRLAPDVYERIAVNDLDRSIVTFFRVLPARLGGSSLMGRKPLAFSVWLFALLGMRPGDELVDLFPGSGAVSAAWRAVSSGAALGDGGGRG